MEERGIAFWGTLFLITFNILIGIFGWFAFNSLSPVWATVFIVPFVAGAIYFDIIVIRYFINKIKEKRSKKNE